MRILQRLRLTVRVKKENSMYTVLDRCLAYMTRPDMQFKRPMRYQA